MIFAALFGRLSFAYPGVRRPCGGKVPRRRGAKYLFIHSVQGARHFLGDVLQLEALDNLSDLWQRTAIAAGNGLAQRECLADHFEIGAAYTAILQTGSGFCAALRTIHKENFKPSTWEQ